MDFYESQPLVEQYLLFHYGERKDIIPYEFGPTDATGYPVRSVQAGIDSQLHYPVGRALDLGCAVGRSTFELAKFAGEVIGIDSSNAFIDAAKRIREQGQLAYSHQIEGDIRAQCVARRPPVDDGRRVHFEVGDAMNLRDDLGEFDIVHMANLIDRLAEPAKCLEQLPRLVTAGGQLIIASPYSWLEEFTPKANWIGGIVRDNQPLTTLEGLRQTLQPAFELAHCIDLPFLLRLHARRFEWTVAQLTSWRRAAH